MPDAAKPPVNWRGRPLTIASLLLLGSIVAGVGAFLFSAQGMVNDAATKASRQTMERHTLPAVDVAHPDLPQRYTPQVEFRLGVQQIRGDLKALQAGQRATGAAIKKLSEQVGQGNRRRRR